MTVVYDDTIKKKSQVSADMFDTCPEVKRMKKMNKSKNLTTEELRKKTQQMGMGMGRMPMYPQPRQPNTSSNQQPSQDGSSDDGSDDGDDE